MNFLHRYFTKEDPEFDFLLVYAQYGIYWRVNLDSMQQRMRPESLIFDFYDRRLFFFRGSPISDDWETTINGANCAIALLQWLTWCSELSVLEIFGGPV
jgi:hypothetical protein